MRAVLRWLLQNYLSVKAEKCEFHSQSVFFLGIILSVSNIKKDPVKVKAVKDFPVPESQKQLEIFGIG